MYSHSAVALIFLAEAHVTMSVALGHASVVHHEKVHFEIVCTSSLDLVMLGTNELDHLHAATFTGKQRGHRALNLYKY